jgi:hypothetical protein
MRSSMTPGLVLEIAAMSLFPAITLVFCLVLLFEVPTVAAAVMESVATFPLWAQVLLVALIVLATTPLFWVLLAPRLGARRTFDALTPGGRWDDRR